MDHIGIDVHKKESQVSILAEGGELIEQRVRTEPERCAVVLGDRPRARIVIEAATAYAAHPARFPVGPPKPAASPTEVWIDSPKTRAIEVTLTH